MPASLQQGRQVETLGDLPIHVISAGNVLAIPGFPAQRRVELQRAWDALQERLTRLSSDAVRTVIAESGHFVQRDRPEAVVAAVESVVATHRHRAGGQGSVSHRVSVTSFVVRSSSAAPGPAIRNSNVDGIV